MKSSILSAIKLTLLCLLLFPGIYTLLVYGIAKLAPNGGRAETTTGNGKVYYTLIAQSFSDNAYFHARPSAVNYNAAGSGGSNKGLSNQEYLAIIQARADSFIVYNPWVKRSEIPAELLTASGSGLDPHISVNAAWVQVKRIALARGLSEGHIQQLILSNTEKPLAGFLGPEKINVVKLNIALDHLSSIK